MLRGRIRGAEIEAEFRAQYGRFLDLVGEPPANVNAHHHVHIFGPVGRALRAVLSEVEPKPFLRRVVEPWRTLAGVRGARVKRLALTRFGRKAAVRQAAEGFPGAGWLVGITDPPFVHRDGFFAEWLAAASSNSPATPVCSTPHSKGATAASPMANCTAAPASTGCWAGPNSPRPCAPPVLSSVRPRPWRRGNPPPHGSRVRAVPERLYRSSEPDA